MAKHCFADLLDLAETRGVNVEYCAGCYLVFFPGDDMAQEYDTVDDAYTFIESLPPFKAPAPAPLADNAVIGLDGDPIDPPLGPVHCACLVGYWSPAHHNPKAVWILQSVENPDNGGSVFVHGVFEHRDSVLCELWIRFGQWATSNASHPDPLDKHPWRVEDWRVVSYPIQG